MKTKFVFNMFVSVCVCFISGVIFFFCPSRIVNFKTNVALILIIMIMMLIVVVVVIHQRSNSLTDCNIYQEMLGFCHSIFVCLETMVVDL